MTSRSIGEIVSLDLERRRRSKNASPLPEAVIAFWPCREVFCREPVGVTASGIHAAEVFDAELARHRKKPLDRNRVMLCPKCAAGWHEREQWRTRDGESGSSARGDDE